MELFINDLSFDGQFIGPNEVVEALQPLLKMRLRERHLKDKLFCTTMFGDRSATPTLSLRNAIMAHTNKEYKKLILDWLNKSGPFWDDSRQHNDDDYFEYQEIDVTDQGLGESSRRNIAGSDAHVFSFLGGRMPFKHTPLVVTHGIRENPLGNVHVVNHWDLSDLSDELSSIKLYRSWDDVRNEILEKFTNLTFSETVMEDLNPTPFSDQLRKRIFVLLDILNNLVKERNEDGAFSEEGLKLLKENFASHCGSKRPLFMPETVTNRRNFKNELTFADPLNDGVKLLCHWHGKIQTPQTRIHFEWPIPANQKKIKVPYIGPKITKE